MSFLVVALLSLLWLGFFLPSLLQARRTSSPYASATTFQASLRRLGEVPYPRRPDGEGQPVAPRGRPSRAAVVAARRRDILAVLAAAVVAGAALAVSFRGWAIWAAVAPAVALTAYVVMLRLGVTRRAGRPRGERSAQVEQAETVARPAPPAPPPAAFDDADIVPSVARRSALPPPERMAG